ncbi:hypothetical protein JCM11641_002182 [Rhodosporidiobolus odoratus]
MILPVPSFNVQLSPAAITLATSHPLAHLDLYALLHLTPSVSSLEIRQAYRALILHAHPDRQSTPSATPTAASGSAEELNAAYEVLREEGTRREWEMARSAYLSRLKATAPPPQAFALSLSLDAFDPHPPPSPEEDPDSSYWTHPCRCSSEFKITRQELEDGIEVVGCQGCSERCRVEYEVVEEEEEEQD